MEQAAATWRMMILYTVLFIVQFVLIILRIAGVIDWNWLLVLIPVWIFILREAFVFLYTLIRVKKLM